MYRVHGNGNLGESTIGLNNKFQVQYKLNETEHHPKMLICCLSKKGLDGRVKKWWSWDLSHILILGV